MHHSKIIGTIVGLKDHAHYLVSVYREGEVTPSPSPDDYILGNFVKIGHEEQSVIGIIVSSQITPETGLGMHFSSPDEMRVFSPELVNEAVHVLHVHGIGILGPDGPLETGIPSRSPSVHDQVFSMNHDEIKRFHSRDGELNIGYLHQMQRAQNPEWIASLVRAMKLLEELLPHHKAVIDLIIGETEWNYKMSY